MVKFISVASILSLASLLAACGGATPPAGDPEAAVAEERAEDAADATKANTDRAEDAATEAEGSAKESGESADKAEKSADDAKK